MSKKSPRPKPDLDYASSSEEDLSLLPEAQAYRSRTPTAQDDDWENEAFDASEFDESRAVEEEEEEYIPPSLGKNEFDRVKATTFELMAHDAEAFKRAHGNMKNERAVDLIREHKRSQDEKRREEIETELWRWHQMWIFQRVRRWAGGEILDDPSSEREQYIQEGSIEFIATISRLDESKIRAQEGDSDYAKQYRLVFLKAADSWIRKRMYELRSELQSGVKAHEFREHTRLREAIAVLRSRHPYGERFTPTDQDISDYLMEQAIEGMRADEVVISDRNVKSLRSRYGWRDAKRIAAIRESMMRGVSIHEKVGGDGEGRSLEEILPQDLSADQDMDLDRERIRRLVHRIVQDAPLMGEVSAGKDGFKLISPAKAETVYEARHGLLGLESRNPEEAGRLLGITAGDTARKMLRAMDAAIHGALPVREKITVVKPDGEEKTSLGTSHQTIYPNQAESTKRVFGR